MVSGRVAGGGATSVFCLARRLSKWGKREGAKTKVGRFLGVLHKVMGCV
jgi:hypothetical protein